MNKEQFAHKVYEDELEREVYHFKQHRCLIAPGLRRQGELLLNMIHRGSISLEDAEQRLGELQIALEEMQQ